MAPVAVGAILFAVFLLIVAALTLQEVRKPGPATPTYVLDEVVPYASARLSEGAASRVGRDDVKRILEWEVYYLQGLGRRGTAPPVAGSREAVDFIVGCTAERGHPYEPADVAEVLYHEASYLAEIGAVGPQAGEVNR